MAAAAATLAVLLAWLVLVPLAANDPNETQIKYGLYRVPLNDGKGGRRSALWAPTRTE